MVVTPEISPQRTSQIPYHEILQQRNSSLVQISIAQLIQSNNSNYNMKDRWKILIASLIIGLVLSLLFLFLGFSFKEVGLHSFGVLQYSFYRTVDKAQSVRYKGNYLVGLDYSFITYPRGLLSHSFTVSLLTKDKSVLSIDGHFVGQLIQSEIINLHFNYGPNNYLDIVKRSVQQLFRQSIEQFLLKQIITIRGTVNSFVSSNVCLGLESSYSFLSCQYVSTGSITINASPQILPPELDVQQQYKQILEQTIVAQQKFNVYSTGGFNLINKVENLNSQLFFNTTQLIVNTVSNYSTNASEIFAGAAYILDNPLMPVLSNQLTSFPLSKGR